jgi:ADP-ribose pyrophosphatase YjhB (NUDIX family)
MGLNRKALTMGSRHVSSEDPPPWVVSASKVVFEHPFVQLVEDAVQLPSGATESWIRHADHREGRPTLRAAGALCQGQDGRFLVSRQWCLGPQRVVHELPGGGVGEDESLEDGVRRELQEEVGLWPRRLEHLGAVLADNRKSSMKIHIYLATDLEERSLPSDDSEVIAWDWMTEAEIDQAISDEVFEHAFLLAGWAMFKARQQHRCTS